MTNDDDWMELVSVADLPQAQLLCSYLEAHDVQTVLPDAQAGGFMWHLSPSLGGIRVLVQKVDLDNAKELMDAYYAAPSSKSEAQDGISDLDHAQADDDINRAYKASIVGLVVFPGFVHLYALFLIVRALVQKTPFASRSKLIVATLLSLSVLAVVTRFLVMVLTP